jgi:surfeit locus 1 family protein
MMTALTAALCVAFVSLGRWQWHRGEQREFQLEQFAQGTERALTLGSRSLRDVPRFQRIRITGHFEPGRQFLLDNISHEGRAGYEVLTPLALRDGRLVLVNRGWVPFTGYRDRLPDVSLSAENVITLTGRVDELPSAGLAQGKSPPRRDAPWPKVTSFPDAADLSRALEHPLESRIVLLDANEPNGYVRAWHPPGLEPARHWSYAIQWWSFAAVLILLWALLSARGLRK